MRGAHVLVPDIFHIIWFCEGSAVSQSVLHHFLSLKGLKRWGVRVSAFWSYSTLFGFGGEVMLYFSQLSTVFYHWRLVYNVFQCSVKGPKGQEVCMSAFWSYSTLFGFGRVLLYLSQFSTIFYHWRLVFNVFLCRLKDWRDEWCVSQCSQNIPHYLVLGGRLCCNCHEPSQPLSQLYPTLGTPCPNIANARNTLPWCSQPRDRPFTLVFHHQDTLSLHHYLLWSCYLVIPCFLISLILHCTHCPSPSYLVHLS